MSTLFVDTINEKTSGNGIAIPGHIVQVKNLFTNSYLTTTSSTLVKAGVNVSITPKFSSSKVLVSISLNGVNRSAGEPRFALYRDDSSLTDLGSSVGQHASTNESGGRSYTYLDSPATTSSIEYQIWFSTTSGTIRINDYMNSNWGERSSILLMEIAQ